MSERWRHEKGGVYEVARRGKAPFDLDVGDVAEDWQSLATDPIVEGEEIVYYRNIETGDCWVRPAWMFDDGRFTKALP